MTKQLIALADGVREQLSRAELHDAQRPLKDSHATFSLWQREGRHLFRLREGVSAPPITSETRLATCPIRRAAQGYILGRDEWIVLARHIAHDPIIVSEAKTFAFAQPLLTYVTAYPGGLASGFFNLFDMPTIKELKLFSGTAFAELWNRKLDKDEIADEYLRLVKTIPYFFAAS